MSKYGTIFTFDAIDIKIPIFFCCWKISRFLLLSHPIENIMFIMLLTKFPDQLVQFSHSVMSHSLRPHELQHARTPCPSPTPGVHPNPYPLSRWCHPTISSSVIPFSSRLHSFPASWSFQMGQFFASGSQSIGVSASTSVLPMNIPDWSPLGWTGWISLQSNGLKSLLQHHTSKASILQRSALFTVQLSHHTWPLEKP